MNSKVVNNIKTIIIVIIVILLTGRFIIYIKRGFDYHNIYKPYKVQINNNDINVNSVIDVYCTYLKGNEIQLNAIKKITLFKKILLLSGLMMIIGCQKLNIIMD